MHSPLQLKLPQIVVNQTENQSSEFCTDKFLEGEFTNDENCDLSGIDLQVTNETTKVGCLSRREIIKTEVIFDIDAIEVIGQISPVAESIFQNFDQEESKKGEDFSVNIGQVI